VSPVSKYVPQRFPEVHVSVSLRFMSAFPCVSSRRVRLVRRVACVSSRPSRRVRLVRRVACVSSRLVASVSSRPSRGVRLVASRLVASRGVRLVASVSFVSWRPSRASRGVRLVRRVASVAFVAWRASRPVSIGAFP